VLQGRGQLRVSCRGGGKIPPDVTHRQMEGGRAQYTMDFKTRGRLRKKKLVWGKRPNPVATARPGRQKITGNCTCESLLGTWRTTSAPWSESNLPLPWGKKRKRTEARGGEKKRRKCGGEKGKLNTDRRRGVKAGEEGPAKNWGGQWKER